MRKITDMEQQVMVSIIIPFFNAEKTLKKTIKSIQDQTYTNWELILIDDGSTDGGSEIGSTTSENDSRIFYYKHNNVGLICSRLRGVERSNGQFIAFVDADDYCSPDMLITMVQHSYKHDIVICQNGIMSQHSLLKYFNGQESDNELKVEREQAEIFCTDLSGISASVWAKLYNIDLFKMNMDQLQSLPKLFWGEDTMLNAVLFNSSASIVQINRCIYYYRVSGGSSVCGKYEFSDLSKLYRWRREFLLKHNREDLAPANLRHVLNRAVYSFSVQRQPLPVHRIADELAPIVADLECYGENYKYYDVFLNLQNFHWEELHNLYKEKPLIRCKQAILRFF